jgi:hypothetical protein
MSSGRSGIEHLAPWLGIVAAAFGWGLAHQIGSNSVFDDCTSRGAGFVVIVGLLCLALVVAGGLFSLDVWRHDESEGRRFIGLVGAMLAALAAFAIVLQSAAALILPSCAA